MEGHKEVGVEISRIRMEEYVTNKSAPRKT